VHYLSADLRKKKKKKKKKEKKKKKKGRTLDTIFILRQQWTDTYKIQGGVFVD